MSLPVQRESWSDRDLSHHEARCERTCECGQKFSTTVINGQESCPACRRRLWESFWATM